MSHGHEPKLQHPEHHVTPPSTYIKVFMGLVVGMIATIAVYFIMPKFGVDPWVSYVNNTIVVLIATAKAYLVVSYFMGVKFGTNLIKMYALLGFVWVTLMTLVFCDYATRHLEPTRGWDGSTNSKYLGSVTPEKDHRPNDPPHTVQ